MARPNDIANRLADLCRLYLRAPVTVASDDAGSPVLVFEPALTAAEQTAYADLLAMAKSGLTATLTLAEYQALKPSMESIRAFQQLSQSEFIALTQNARDRQLFDVANAHTRVLRALLRD